MPTNFLTLTNNLLRRLNEVIFQDQSDFASSRGVQTMAKDSINASIEMILQAEPIWPFNVGSTTQLLTIGQSAYDFPTDLKMVNWRSFHLLNDDTLNISGNPLQFISRDQYYRYLKTDDDLAGSDGRDSPKWVFEKQGNGFQVSPSPNQAYTVSYDYWPNNIALTTYDTTSTIPSNYDEVIIQGALYHFYMFRDNAQSAKMAEERFLRQLSDMRTMLVNKEDRVTTGYRPKRKLYGRYAEPLYPLV